MNVIAGLKNLHSRAIFGYRWSPEAFVKHLRKSGVEIGEGTVFHGPRTTFIDPQRPWLIKIGKNVQITENVTILTHDYSWSVIKDIHGEILGSAGKVTIGDNVLSE